MRIFISPSPSFAHRRKVFYFGLMPLDFCPNRSYTITVLSLLVLYLQALLFLFGLIPSNFALVGLNEGVSTEVPRLKRLN